MTLSNDGNRVAIGEPYAFTGDQQTGRVRVFDWDGTTWSQTGATLAGTNMGQQFGYAVALSGDGSRIALSAPAVTPDMERPAGHVRVHEWDGGTWRQAGSDITEPDGGIREWGQSIAISDDGQVLAVGVTYTPGAPGRVYLSPWDGADWTATDRYLEGRARDDRFGASIALTRSGERIVIGAAGSIDVPGYVRVYQRDGATWRQFGDDFEIDANEADLSVAITDDGNRIAFSTPRSGSGRVRVHDWSGSAWEPAGSDIVDSTDSGFGRSLALSGDGNRIVISGESAIGVHDWDGIAWLQRATIDTQTPDVFSPPSLGISRDGSRFAVDRPRLRVYAGPVADAPATTTTTSAAITIPPTGTGTAAGAGMLAAVLLLCGLTALATTRRGC